MKNNCFQLILLVLVLVGVSCKSKKLATQTTHPTTEVAKPNSKVVLIQTIEKQQNTFSYYSANGKVSYKDPDTKQELGVNIVMEKDRFIYLNITAVLGITVARVLATQDSIVMLDMLHRKCIIARYDYIRNLTHADFNLSNLQNLFIGNTLFRNIPEKSKVDSILNYVLISQAISNTHAQQTFYKSDLKISRSTVMDPLKNQEIKVEYEDVYTQGANQLPQKFSINIQGEKKIETHFELTNFVFEKKKEIQFTIPKSYETIRM
jgi:hypothetical protein